MDNILKQIEEDEEANEVYSLEHIMRVNPEILTLDNPMTFIMYLDMNKGLSTEARETVIRIIKKLSDKKNKINEINMKKFEEQEKLPLENIFHGVKVNGEIISPDIKEEEQICQI
jgi:uncharacterized protein Smg (DUF494 family)